MYQEEGGVPVLAPRHSHQARMGPVADKLVFNHAFEQRASITKDRDQGPCSSPPPLRLNVPSVQHLLYLNPQPSILHFHTLNPQPSTKTPRVY